MTNPLPPTDSPAGIADGEIETLKNLVQISAEHQDSFHWDRVCHFTWKLLTRLKRAEAERDDWKYSAEKRGITLNTALKYIREKRAAIKQLESECARMRAALEPFADMANSRFEGTADDESIYVMLSIDVASICKTARFGNIHSATVGDLRRAAAALADAGKGGGE